MNLYEIFVPIWRNGKKISVDEHEEWDMKVSDITGGLTLYQPIKGKYKDQENIIFDCIIPVRIACTAEEMELVAGLTKEFYRQKEVMYWRVSDQVFIV